MNNNSTKPEQYFITDSSGMSFTIVNVGASLKSLKVPTESGLVETILSYKKPEDYLQDKIHMGAVAGRYANRIAKGQFSLDGEEYQLTQNIGFHHLHGGDSGFNQKTWHLTERYNGDSPGIKLECFSEDGEQGYPGNVKATVCYRIKQGNKLVIDLNADSDKATPLNLTGHAYFNLNGDGGFPLASTIENHLLQVNADYYLPTDVNCIPTGELKHVANSDLDFRETTHLIDRIRSDMPAIKAQKGIDHNLVINHYNEKLQLAASLTSPKTKIQMLVYTNMPGLQVYTGNHLEKPFKQYQGICLEPQLFPDSPNHENFPNSILRPDKTYWHRIVYEFL